MRTEKKNFLWLCKILLVALMTYSQIYSPIIVFAEELTPSSGEETVETNTEKEVTTEESEQKDAPEIVTKSEVMLSVEGATESNDSYITEGTEVTFKLSYEEEEKQFTYNITLPGTYKVKLSNTFTDGTNYEKEVSIIKNGNALEKAGEYLEGTIGGKNITIDEKTLIIPGSIEGTKVTDINSFFKEEFFTNNNVEIAASCNTEIITNTCTFTFKNLNSEFEDVTYDTYNIQIFGDYTEDGKLSQEDMEKLMDLLVNDEKVQEENINTYDINGDGAFDILDVSHSVFTDGMWLNVNETDFQDELTNTFVNKSVTYVGEEIEVKYSINGFEKDVMDGFYGKINYNKELLKLTNIELPEKVIFSKTNENTNEIAMVLDHYQSNEVMITLTFEALAKGDANISIDEIVGAYAGAKMNIEDSIFTTVTIDEYGKGGDEAQEETTTPVVPTEAPVPQQTNYSSSYIRPIRLSSDSLIRSLTVKEYDLKFESNKFEYSFSVPNKVKSLNLTIVLSDPSATYVVNGNENFKVGENVVTIVVTAEDGSTSTYTLKVNRKKAEKKEEEKEEKKSSKAIIIILIVLVILGLIYVIFKDDEEDKE